MRKFWPGAAALWMIFIAVVCLVRFENLPDVEIPIGQTDKIVHGGLHFVLTLLLFVALKNRRLLGAFCISAAYGICIELLQGMLTISRTADIIDVLANLAGSTLAVALVILRQKN